MTQTLNLALRARGDEGQPLPSVFSQLRSLNALHRKGQVSLVAAAPGGGKSGYATHYAVNAGVPTLYLSPDSDRMTLAVRVLAGILNISLGQAEALIDDEDDEALDVLLQTTEHIWWNFDPGPSLRDIKKEVDAYAVVNGEYPSLLILDNLKDVVGAEDNQTKYHETVDFLHQLARETGSHVLILHHTLGEYEDGVTPIPLRGLLNKVGKTPRLVLTFFNEMPGLLSICIVKNNNGPANANAELRVNVGWLPERSWFDG